MLEKRHQQYIKLEELSKEYYKYVNSSTLPMKKVDAYKQTMLIITVGLMYFYNKKDIIDLQVAHLLKDWGHLKVRLVSITMVFLAFLYHRLNIFVSGKSDVIEGQ